MSSITSPRTNQGSRSWTRRSGEHSRHKDPQDGKTLSSKLTKKSSRSSDEEGLGGRISRVPSISTSSIFSQPNSTFEDTGTIPVSPTMATSKSGTSSRSQKSTSRPSSQSFARTFTKVLFQQPTVEDEIEESKPAPTLVKTNTREDLDFTKEGNRPDTFVAARPDPVGSELAHADPLFRFPTASADASVMHERKKSEPPPPLISTDAKPTSSEAQVPPGPSVVEALEKQTDNLQSGPRISTPQTSPPQSPRLYGYNTYSYPPLPSDFPQFSNSRTTSPIPHIPPGQPQYHYGYGPMMTGPPPSTYGGHYYGMPYTSPVESVIYGTERPRSPLSANDEHQQLMTKVAEVLPDINRLLSSYKDTDGQLSAKELLVKQADISHNEALTRVQMELEATKKEYEKVIQNVVSDRGKAERELKEVRQKLTNTEKMESENKAMRKELAALQADKKEMAEGLDAVRRSREEMQNFKLANEREIESLKKTLQSEKDRYHRNIMDVKDQAQDHMDQKQRDYYKSIDNHKLNYAKVQAELTALLSRFSGQKRDLESVRSSEAELKMRLSLKARDMDDAYSRHAHEVDSIKKKYKDERERMAREGEDRVARLNEEHSQKEKEWHIELHDMGAELESARTESQKHQDDLEAERKRKDAEKFQRSAELIEGLASWRTRSEELQKENQYLDKLLQGLAMSET